MEIYNGFSMLYDLFMDNIPYDDWSEYIIGLLKEYNIEDSLVLELGCGTGNITQRLSQAGYDMIGIDNSEEMLEIAMEKMNDDELFQSDDKKQILYLLQDMRDFELYGTVSAVVSACDCMNYLMSEEELLSVFRLINNYLDEGGIFIFDLNTEYKYRAVMADHTIAENRDEGSFIWDNYYYEDEMVNEYGLTIYIKEDISAGSQSDESSQQNIYRRYEETHYQKAYSINTVKEVLEKAGMEFITAYDAFTHEPPKEDSERIYIVAREGRQEEKTYL